MDALTTIKVAAELNAWEEVPGMVVASLKEAAFVAGSVRKLLVGLPHTADTRVYWDKQRKTLNISLPDKADAAAENAWHNRLKDVRGVENIWIDREWVPKDNVPVKTAAANWLDPRQAYQTAGKAIGGPYPLTDAIVGSLLAGTLGYGAGTALEHLFPDRYMEQGKLRKTLGLTGAAVGAIPGLYKADLYGRVDGTNPVQGLISSDYPTAKAAELLHDVPVPAMLEKLAFGMTGLGGNIGIPSIPVDAFNRMVWRDARKGVMSAEFNPYGSKSPWGDNTQQLHTPPQVAAATTAITSGVAQQLGSSLISVDSLVRGVAGAAGGLAAATLAGKAIGALAGLTPQAQDKLQDAGIFAGILTAVIPPLFQA